MVAADDNKNSQPGDPGWLQFAKFFHAPARNQYVVRARLGTAGGRRRNECGLLRCYQRQRQQCRYIERAVGHVVQSRKPDQTRQSHLHPRRHLCRVQHDFAFAFRAQGSQSVCVLSPARKSCLDFSGEATGSDGISISGDCWWLYGLETTNAGHNGIVSAARRNIVERCVVHNSRNTGIHITGDTSTGYNLVLNCDSYHN